VIADDVSDGPDGVEVVARDPRDAPVAVLFSKVLADILDLFFLEVLVKKWSANGARKCALAVGALVAQPAVALFSLAYDVEKSDFIVSTTILVGARNILFLSYSHEKHLKLSSEEQVYKDYYSRSIRT